MHVLMNAQASIATTGGVGQYVRMLAKHLAVQRGSSSLSFLYGGRVKKSIGPEPPVGALDSGRRWFRRWDASYWLRYQLNAGGLRWVETRNRYSVYHETGLFPLPFSGPRVMTVYDLSIVKFPQTHPRARVAFYEKKFLPALQAIDHFITISHSVKEEMVRAWSLPSDKITVTPLGKDTAFYPREGEALSAALKSRWGLSVKGYFLSVGTLEPRKNLSTLFAAYARVPVRERARHPLVVVGPLGWMTQSLDVPIDRWHLGKDVIRLGTVSSEDLPLLYSGARAFFWPSLYEGFGLPVLEAMSCGAPVFGSDIATVQEVGGRAVRSVPATSIESWTEAFRTAWQDDAALGSMQEKGLRQASLFKWETCAQKTWDVYRRFSSSEGRNQ